MRFAFVLHPDRSEAVALADRATDWLKDRGHEVDTLPDAAGPGASVEGADLVVSFGGDGTMLKAVEVATAGGVPVLGVNLGRLGYLAEVEPDDIERALEAAVGGTLQVEERMTLAVTVTTPSGATGPELIALNEAVVEKTVPGHTVRLEASVDDRPFVTFAADGVLAATPTGSTAYNLSARGPIVSPRLRAIVVTPVSPHMLFDRPLVLEPTERLRLTVGEPRAAVLVVDGATVATLEPGASVTCRAGDRPARLVIFENRDFHAILRAKFHLADR